MRHIGPLFFFVVLLVACSGATESSPEGPRGATGSATNPSVGSGAPASQGGASTPQPAPTNASPDAAVLPTSADAGGCSAPQGDTCPPTTGNCKGIGHNCTKGGGQCNALGLTCDVDLDPRGEGMCISILKCGVGKGECGAGASCCQTQDTNFIPVCIPNVCIAADSGCTPEN